MQGELTAVRVRFAHGAHSVADLQLLIPQFCTVAHLKAQIRLARPAVVDAVLRLTCGGRELCDGGSAACISGVVLCLVHHVDPRDKGTVLLEPEAVHYSDLDTLPPDWMDSVDPSAVLGWTFGILLIAVAAWHTFSGEPCSRSVLIMLASMTAVYVILFLPQLRTCLALVPPRDATEWEVYDACGECAGLPSDVPARPPAPLARRT